MNRTVFTEYSKDGIERLIDEFLVEKKPFKDLRLVLTVENSTRYNYRGITIREWTCNGNVRFDAAIELTA